MKWYYFIVFVTALCMLSVLVSGTWWHPNTPDFVINETLAHYDLGVKVNTTTLTDRYNITDNTAELDFPLADKDPDLISYHRFEAPTAGNYLDESGNGYHLSVTAGVNAPTWSSSGKYGGGMDFERDNAEGLNNTAYYDISTVNTWTMCAWFKQESSANNYMGVQLGQSPQTGGNGIALRAALQKWQIYVYTPTGTHRHAILASNHNIGQWYFVCGSVNASDAVLYVDGSQSAHNSGTAGTLDYTKITDDRLTLGEPDAAYGNYPYDGLIDEIKVYKRVLTPAEISYLYNSNKKYRSSGTWTSDTQTITAGNQLANMTLNITADANNYIDKIEILKASDSSVLYTNNTDLKTSGLHTMHDTSAVTENFKVKVYLAGNGDGTPVINDIIGYYEEIPVTITPTTPLNTSYCASNLWFNLTLNKDGSWAGFSLDGLTNVTMTNSTGNWNYLYSLSSFNCTDNTHNVTFYANDTLGNMGYTTTTWFWVCCCGGTTSDLPLEILPFITVIVAFTLLFVARRLDGKDAMKILYFMLTMVFIIVTLFTNRILAEGEGYTDIVNIMTNAMNVVIFVFVLLLMFFMFNFWKDIMSNWSKG
jgi:peptide methionine sulfoxide reductase MsrB